MTNKEAIFKLVNSEISLKDIPQFNNDKEIVKAAVEIDGDYLKYASEDLRNDKEIVLLAISDSSDAFQYAHDLLKSNREVVLEVLSKNGHALQYVSENLKNDKEIVMLAVSKYGDDLIYASEELKNDKDFAIKCIELSNENIKYISINLLRDIEFLRQVAPLINRIFFLRNIPAIIFNNPVFVSELYTKSNGNIIINYTISLETEDFKILANGPLLINSEIDGDIYSLRNLRVEDYNGKIPYPYYGKKIPYPIIEEMAIYRVNYGGCLSTPTQEYFLGGYGIKNNKIMFSKGVLDNLGGDIGKYFISHYVPQIIELEQSIGKLKLIDWTDNMTWDGRTLTIKPKS